MRRRSAGVLAALVAAAVLAAGCGSGEGNGPETLTVYVSVPLHGPRAADGAAIAAGAKRALRRAGGRVGGILIRAVFLDDTGGGPGWSMVATAANARRAAEDSAAVGFIGDVDSGATRVSLPITNQAEIVQISPASTAVDLTLDSSNGLGPERYQPSGEATFARIVPNNEVLDKAARAARRAGGSQALPVPDGALAAALKKCRPGAGAPILITPFALPPRRYGEEAMSLLLDSIRRAEPDPGRGSVLDELLATANRHSPLGRYSIDSYGDTTLRRVGKLHLRECGLQAFSSIAYR